MTVSSFTVYTLLHPDKLAGLAKARRATRLRATKRWVTAKKLFEEARAAGETVPVVYADAAYDCSKLIYWGQLTDLEVDASGTTYTVKGIRPLEGHRTQELVLESTGRTIAEGYLRPYAIVRTPPFLPLGTSDGPITMFSFGYWGTGGAAPQLVEIVDAAEEQRGFGPPMWVDVRIRRSVRAAGFRGDAFERLLGPRYVWMRDLGNLNIELGIPGIQIKEPAAAEELLDLAVRDLARRVIFFCSCEHPAGCHRQEVCRLVRKAARARGVEIMLIEWPGGEPRSLTADVPQALFHAIVRGSRHTIPVPRALGLGEAGAIPWGSCLRLRSRGEETTVLVGPARVDASGPHLSVIDAGGDESAGGLADAARRYRGEYGYRPIR